MEPVMKAAVFGGVKVGVVREAAGSVVTFFAGAAVAGGATFGQAVPQITLEGSFYGAIGGVIGGILAWRFSPVRLHPIDGILTIVVSAMIGFAVAPISAIMIGHHWGWWSPTDLMVRIPLGMTAGAIFTALYPLFVALVAAAKSSPQSIPDWFAKWKTVWPRITIGGKKGEDE